MCIENKTLSVACAHRNRGHVDYCTKVVSKDSVPICPDHRVYLTLAEGFCSSCCLTILKRYPDTAFHVARSVRFVSAFWTDHALFHDRLDAEKPRLVELKFEDAMQTDVDFDANQDWLETLQLAIASCVPEAVVMGTVLWPDNPWFGTASKPDRLTALARAAQLRTIRWAAGLDLDAA